ncbi:cell surface protein, partial [Bifidobacteriaceae bacterium NR021]
YHSYEGYGGLDLKVVNKPKGARIEWRYVRADEGPDAYGTTLFAERLQLPAEPAMNKMKVYAHATEGETQVGKDTASATIVVEDHGADGHPVVKAIVPYKRFKPGDTLHAKTVLLNPHVATDATTGEPIDDPTNPVTSIVKDYVWLMKKEGESEFKRIPGAVSSKLDLKLDASMQGATIRPSLVLKNGELYRNKMFDEFCDYVIEMKGVPHSHNNDGDDDQSGSDSEDDENPHGKKRHEKRHKKSNNKRHNKRKNKTNHFAGGRSFLKGVFGGTENSGIFGSNFNGGFQFESNFFKKSNKKLKRTKNNHNKINRTNRKNNSKNNVQNGSGSGSGSGSSSFTRTENSSGKSSHNSSRRTSGGTNTKNKSSKKSGQTIRNFVRTDNNSGNNFKNSSVNNSDFVKNNERHALQDARQYDEESDESYEDDSDDTKGNSSSNKWVAVAASSASVGLCTITGACGALVRSKLKLL